MSEETKTLQQAMLYFSHPDNCLNYIVRRRWASGVTCPRCGAAKVYFLPSRRLWECTTKHPRRQFSVKVGTIFEDSPLGLDKWLPAVWLVTNCKSGVSSYEIARDLKVTQKTAWFMLHRIRLALQNGTVSKLGGEVEVDETFIGGKARNMHVAQRQRRITGTGGKDKTVVVGIMQRLGQVRATVAENRKKRALQAEAKKHVEEGSALYSDALLSSEGIRPPSHRSRRRPRGRVGSHQRPGELLGPAEAWSARNL